MQFTDISIVIVNYNVRDYLEKCLHSVRGSRTNLKIQTIVVDNNSTDGSVGYLQSRFPEVEFYEMKSNLGFSKANNAGFEKAKGKYILILNPDTILSDDTLDTMYEYMEENDEVWMAGCKILNPDGSFQLPCRRGFPTPFVAFSKLFGLQSLFPKSKIFARYNQTFRSENETYYIDAIMGAFMFARADRIRELGGFDPDYFMYGEDLDLCYRTALAGGKVSYVHKTTIVHFKGESTKRSSINDIKHFYEAMQIFVRKHYANSGFFLAILKLGIFLRTSIAYLLKNKKELPVIIIDLLIVNLVLMVSTSVKFGELLGFPEYAYPTVFIVISGVLFLSMFSVGEYFEGDHSVRKFLFGVLISFFFLSALTYFFKDYAFSRGVLLMTIGLTFIFGSLYRFGMISLGNMKKKKSRPKVAVVASGNKLKSIMEEITGRGLDFHLEICGYFAAGSSPEIDNSADTTAEIIGNAEYLANNLAEIAPEEIIIFGDNNSEEFNLLFAKSLDKSIPLHCVSQLDDYLISKTISGVASGLPALRSHRLILPRFKVAKRLIDIVSSTLMLTLGLPFALLRNSKDKKYLNGILNVLKGNYSLIGIYPSENIRNYNAKPGLLNLADFSEEVKMSNESIKKLNDYYEQNYSLSLDFDILIKSIFK